MDTKGLIDAENELLDSIPLPGNPKSERERREKWNQLPRRVRLAIRRLHRNFKHLPKQAMVAMLRAAKAPKEFIEAAKSFRCDTCAVLHPKPQTHKISAPKPYVFNRDVGIDVFEVLDTEGQRYDILHAVCQGVTYQQGWIVRVADTVGTPSSLSCLKAFTQGWVRCAGWPNFISCDRGMHNRGVFSQTVQANGVRIRPAGLESPEQIGRVERRGDILKKLMKRIIKETNAVGRDSMDMILTEALNALNEMSRHGGFAPSQWVLSKLPRTPGCLGDEEEAADIGAIQGHIDGPTEFGIQTRYRHLAREAFIRWDCSEKVGRAVLRKAAPLSGDYRVGDIVSYCRDARAGESGIQWSIGSRIVGFEYKKGQDESDTPQSETNKPRMHDFVHICRHKHLYVWARIHIE